LARLRWQRLANLGGEAFLPWLLGRVAECPGDDRRGFCVQCGRDQDHIGWAGT
jgi:hypothetical protein